MAKSKPIVPRSLRGTWKSDKRLTLRHFSAPYGGTRKGVKLLRSLFGKLIVRWGRKYVYTDLDDFKSREGYEVLAHDEHSVVVRYVDSRELQQIHFDDRYYWVWAGFTREYFAPLPPTPSRWHKAARGRS